MFRGLLTLFASQLFAVVALVMFAGGYPAYAQRGAKPCNPNRQNCADTTPPTVGITQPTSGATVSGQVTIKGAASDNVSVSKVEVRVDGGPFQLATGTTSWSFVLDTTLYVNGSHTISARSTDRAGNTSALSSINLNFDNRDPNVLSISAVRVDPPTLHTLGVQVLISGDKNRNAKITVRYQQAGSSEWREGLPLMRVFPETVSVSVPQQFAGSVFDLTPATDYEIELHALDQDGSVDITQIVRATTRPVPRTDPTTPRVVNVSDATALKAALSGAKPGDVITVADGRYVGPFVLNASGTPEQPIVIRGLSTSGVLLDGNNCTGCNLLEVYGSFVHVERLTIANAIRGLRFLGVNATGNVARRLVIQNVVHGIGSYTGQSNFYIADNDIDGRLQWPWVFASDATSHWDDRGIEVTGDGHVVCHNKIRGFGDPVVNKKRQARSWDVYGNDIADAWDGVELDEGEGNVRLFRNRFTNVMAPISIQPVFGGPAYALRNVMYNIPDEPIKLKSLGGVEEPSGALIYHNTFVSPKRALNLQASITQHNFVIENNLFVGPRALEGTRAVDWTASIDQGLFDDNGYFPDGDFMFGYVGGVARFYPNFAAVKSSGVVEQNGVLLTEPIFQAGFVGPTDPQIRYTPPDFTLAANSLAADRSQRLPGVNDGVLAPDLGALERGCPVPTYGPRPEGEESTTWAINCR